MCKWGTTKPVLVFIDAEHSHSRRGRWTEKPVDSCIADIVAALNQAGIFTTGCCCGHGKRRGEILLKGGRKLIISKSKKLTP